MSIKDGAAEPFYKDFPASQQVSCIWLFPLDKRLFGISGFLQLRACWEEEGWGQVLLVAIGKQHSLHAKPHSESRQASGKT